jgi:hypothetical protein
VLSSADVDDVETAPVSRSLAMWRMDLNARMAVLSLFHSNCWDISLLPQLIDIQEQPRNDMPPRR